MSSNERHPAGKAFVIAAACASIALALLPGVAQAAMSHTWYVRAAAKPGGTGTYAKPFAKLASVERVSRPGDTIVVLPARASTSPLDGGIALKRGQRLMGSGPSVRGLTPSAAAPRLTNSSASRHHGDAVVLADGATVSNLLIVDPFRGAIYGRDVGGVTITGNDVSGQNASCTAGFLIPEFIAPTSVPSVGIPISGGLQNGWAGIMVDASKRTDGTVNISNNTVHDAECGDGIDLRISGTAAYRATIARNKVHSLRQGRSFKSVLAIGLQARDTGRFVASLDRNSQSNLGNADELNLAAEGADSEGVFVNGVGPSTMNVTLTHNTYTNERGIGGFSANGMELVTMGNGSRVTMRISDSHFSGSPGDVMEEGALGTNAKINLTIDRVTAERSTGVGNTYLLPFNNGDCLLAGSLGAGNSIGLTVRDSVFRDCSNNGISLGSNVVNGTGPTKEIIADIRRTTATGNRGGNLGIRNFTGLDRLSVRVEDSDLRGSKSFGSSVADFAADDIGTTASSTIDIGGGALGSAGGNCMVGGLFAAEVINYTVSARHNWWGQAGGPRALQTSAVGGALDTTSPLSEAPRACL